MEIELVTDKVEILNDADIDPGATVTEAGTAALELLDMRLIIAPPDAAGPLKVTVPDALKPPITEVGFNVRLANPGVTASDELNDVLPTTAETVAEMVEFTTVVAIENVAVLEPTGTLRLDGGAAHGLFDDNWTTNPPLGAGPLRVNVAVEGDPPTTETGEITRLDGTGWRIFRFAENDVLAHLAKIDAVPVEATAIVEMLNDALFAPAGTVTLPGGVAMLLPEVRLTVAPPVGAGPFNETMPVDELPPVTDVGDKVSPFNTAGVTVIEAFKGVSPKDAVIVATVTLATAEVVSVNVAWVAPAATVTVAGGTAHALFDDKLIAAPPAGAGLLSVTVPVDGKPPNSEVGDNVRLCRTADVTERVPFTDVPPIDPVITAETDATTAVVVTVKVTDLAPEGTVTLLGGTADALLDDKATTAPLVGAGPFNVRVPVEVKPPKTVSGDNVRL